MRFSGGEKGVRGRFDTLRDKGIAAGRVMRGMWQRGVGRRITGLRIICQKYQIKLMTIRTLLPSWSAS